MGDNITKVGLSAMNSSKGADSGASVAMSLGDSKVSIARVTFVLLDDSNQDKFKKLGGWKSLGAIECVSFINNNNSSAEPIVAYPLDTNTTKFPVENELVLLINLVSYKAQSSIENYDPRVYYISVVPGFNAVSHNAIPNEAKLKSNDVTGIFKDIVKVSPLLKQPGDLTLESRSGSSIRVGSIIEGFNSPFSGKNRSPLLILSNNRRTSSDPKLPLFEDVNKDGATIAMLSPNQSINFTPASTNFDSYGETVQSSNKNNYVVPKPEKEPIEASPQVSDAAKIDTAKDKVPEKQEVKSREVPEEKSNDKVDSETLPNNENLEFFEETRPYIFTNDVIQYDDAEEDVNDYVPTQQTVDIKNFSSLPNKILKNKNFIDFVSSPNVKERVSQIANKIGCSENDLYAVMYAESEFLTYAVNKQTKATGLIQFMPKTAKLLGTTVESLKKMNYLQQLVYVEKYFLGANKKLKNAYDLYGFTFVPISVGKPLNWVFQWKGVSAYMLSSQNPAIAKAAGKKPGDPVTIADFYKYVNKVMSK